jgi:hypothetical protein
VEAHNNEAGTAPDPVLGQKIQDRNSTVRSEMLSWLAISSLEE